MLLHVELLMRLHGNIRHTILLLLLLLLRKKGVDRWCSLLRSRHIPSTAHGLRKRVDRLRCVHGARRHHPHAAAPHHHHHAMIPPTATTDVMMLLHRLHGWKMRLLLLLLLQERTAATIMHATCWHKGLLTSRHHPIPRILVVLLLLCTTAVKRQNRIRRHLWFRW